MERETAGKLSRWCFDV